MTATSNRLIASIVIVSFFVFGAGTAFASTGQAAIFARSASLADFCPAQSRLSNARARSNKTRVAWHCYCCRWQNWSGHKVCVHQCCN